MTAAPPSPKRRHILSSINPEQLPIADDVTRTPEPTAYHPQDTPLPPNIDEEVNSDTKVDGNTSHDRDSKPRKTSKFRFKSSSHRSSRHHRNRDRDRDRERDLEGGDDNDREHHRHRRHHDHNNDGEEDYPRAEDDDPSRHHHHRHKRRRRHRHRSRTRSPTPPNPYDPPPLSPEAAFRASLFDAMADDEGAAYWEAVYGQPMHVYSRSSSNTNANANANANANSRGGGELEQMDDEEYAAHVRQRMWEKTHQGLLEERARREERRRRREEEQKEARRLTRDMEESLRRGEERRRRKGWRGRWEAYVREWAEWEHAGSGDNNNNNNSANTVGAKSSEGDHDKEEQEQEEQEQERGRHPLENDAGAAWPVESGRRADIRGGGGGEDGKADAVREFFVRGLLDAQQEDGVGEASFAARLKDERVRWHPDKIQQRLGGQGVVGDALMRDVTAVFQAVDRLWSDMRPKQKER